MEKLTITTKHLIGKSPKKMNREISVI